MTDEYIKREDALSALNKSMNLTECRKRLERITRADVVEMRHGKWIYHDDDDMRYDTYHCSVCRKLFTVDAKRVDDIGFVIDDLNFCPHCGTRCDL